MNWFRINSQLPSLNQYTNACRSHWSAGAKMKEEIETLIGWEIRSAVCEKHLLPVGEGNVLLIEWHEATRKRDVDNIQSAKKFIIDALVKNRILPDDGRKYILQIYDKIVDDDKDFIIVRIEKEEKHDKK